MSELAVYSCIMVASALISSFSQIMLKKSAQKTYPSKIREYLNPLVIFAYGLFFLCTLISMYALKVVPLSMSPVLEASGYIFVAVLSYIFFKERLTKRQLLGMALIISGIVIYTLKL
ncbi:MAG: EamA family transporter [Firmicutes bacterium]|nr:EamA family transporter [[Eubacterium] siraeum]MCM1487876.1 EamA family transporter [Bacillota bacterium]